MDNTKPKAAKAVTAYTGRQLECIIRDEATRFYETFQKAPNYLYVSLPDYATLCGYLGIEAMEKFIYDTDEPPLTVKVTGKKANLQVLRVTTDPNKMGYEAPKRKPWTEIDYTKVQVERVDNGTAQLDGVMEGAHDRRLQRKLAEMVENGQTPKTANETQLKPKTKVKQWRGAGTRSGVNGRQSKKG